MALRDDIVAAIAFVLRLRIGRRQQRALELRDEQDARILAERIVAHLELCRFRFSQAPPDPPHSTPASRPPDRDPP